MFNVDHN